MTSKLNLLCFQGAFWLQPKKSRESNLDNSLKCYNNRQLVSISPLRYRDWCCQIKLNIVVHFWTLLNFLICSKVFKNVQKHSIIGVCALSTWHWTILNIFKHVWTRSKMFKSFQKYSKMFNETLASIHCLCQ